MVSFLRLDSSSSHLEILANGDCRRTGDRRQVSTEIGTLPFASWYVRSGKWKLIGWNSDTPLLFDVSADPGEYKNLAAQYPEVVNDLHKEFS